MTLNYQSLRHVKGNPSIEVASGRRLQVIPGQDYLYDMPKELIQAVGEKFPLASLLDQAENRKSLPQLGETLMHCMMELADSDRFRDRTAEMIEIVAQQTGILFPHCFERYVELGILAIRPRDAWAVTKATTSGLTVKSYNCSLNRQLTEKGIANCQEFCLAAAQAAAHKAGVSVIGKCGKDMASGICQLSFHNQKEG